MVYQNTDAYYNAIAAATEAGESTPFIVFMLSMLDEALSQGVSRDAQPEAVGANDGIKWGAKEKHLLQLLRADGRSTAASLAPRLGVEPRQVERLLAKLKKAGVLVRTGSRKAGAWQVCSPE